MTLNRLEVSDAGTVVIPAAGGTTSLGTLAGSGTVLFKKGVSEQATLPVEVTSSVQIPGGSKIKVGHTGGGWADTWGNTLLFQGAGITALDSASCFSSRDAGFYLTKTEDGTGIQVQEGTEQKATDIYPTPHFDRPSYQYGETMTITMGLRSEGQDPVPGQTLEVRGGVSGLQTFATAVTDAGGEARFTLPVDDNLWASRESGLQAIFHGTENYKESFYGISLRDRPDSMSYIVTGAQIVLDGEITAPARGEVPVKTLSVSGGGICTAEVIWAPADAVFRPEVTYTAGIRLVPKPGFRLGDGKLASATYQGSELTLSAAPEADGSMLLANVETFAAIPAIHPTGVTLSASALTLSPGGGSQLTASVAPENADNKAVVWTSSNPAVAEVDASGQVTAKGAGTAVITVTTADGSFTAFCTVTVTSASGGSSGSGGSGGGTGGGSPATTTTKNPDGTTTTTTTDPAAGTVTDHQSAGRHQRHCGDGQKGQRNFRRGQHPRRSAVRHPACGHRQGHRDKNHREGRRQRGGGDPGGEGHPRHCGGNRCPGRHGDGGAQIRPHGKRRGPDGGGLRRGKAGGARQDLLRPARDPLGGGCGGLRQRPGAVLRHRPRYLQPLPAHEPRHAGGGAPQSGE